MLLRRLTAFDLTLITISSVVGSGIFRTPAAVARRAHDPAIVLGCWIAGGAIALIGAFIYAELAARRPLGGGLYAYLRDVYHPIVGFLFGWTLLLISGSGSNAAAAVLFAGYLGPLTGLTIEPRVVAVVTLAALAGINLLGVRQGGTWQSFVVVLKVAAIGGVIVACFIAHPHRVAPHAPFAFAGAAPLLAAIGTAMLPVLFTYAGFQGATFVTAETRDPQRTIPFGLLMGIAVIIALYLAANAGYLRMLGIDGVAATTAPASEATRAAVGDAGGRLIALAIALSTLGYLSTCMLAYPRIYYQMAADGTFFKGVAWVSPATHVPVVAIVLQAAVAAALALSGTYEQIINWVVAPQWLFILLGATTLFVFRARDRALPKPATTIPGHPFTTIVFVVVLLAIFTTELWVYPRDTFFGAAILLAGVVMFYARRLVARVTE